MKKRGIYKEVSDADTDTTILTVPNNRIAYITEIQIRNPNASAARVRLWDKYTIDTTSYSKQKLDVTVAANDTVVFDTKDAKHIIGQLVAQSDTAPVQIYVGVELI